MSFYCQKEVRCVCRTRECREMSRFYFSVLKSQPHCADIWNHEYREHLLKSVNLNVGTIVRPKIKKFHYDLKIRHTTSCKRGISHLQFRDPKTDEYILPSMNADHWKNIRQEIIKTYELKLRHPGFEQSKIIDVIQGKIIDNKIIDNVISLLNKVQPMSLGAPDYNEETRDEALVKISGPADQGKEKH